MIHEPFLQVNKENVNNTILFFYDRELALYKESRKFLKTYKNGLYLKKPIEYTFNRLGYRCKYSDIPNTDYILVLGCSHTFGSGLHEEHRYTNLLEDNYGIPVLNISYPGGAPNLVRDNLIQLCTSDKRLPTLVIIQWPHEYRLTIGQETFGPWTAKLWGKNHFFVKGLERVAEYSQSAKYQSNKLLAKFKVPLIELEIFDSLITPNQGFQIDVARDRDHCGIDSNKKICEYLIGKINDLRTFT